jgi:type I restriction enzyme R subunit
MEHRITKADEEAIVKTSGGRSLKDLARRIVESIDPDRFPPPLPLGEGRGEGQDEGPALQARQDAIKPLLDPKFRELLIDIKKKNELTIDHVSKDQVIEAGFSADALARARTIVQSFEQFIQKHKDEITALRILYTVPARQRVTQAGKRLTFEHIKELADAIEKPPYLWNESQLWQAYAALEKSKVKGASGKRILTDLVSLVRFAIHQDNELVPFPERVNANFNAWLLQQESIPSPRVGEGKGEGRRFTSEQLHWLEMIRDHVAANLGIEKDDFELAPFAREGGLGKAHWLFPESLQTIIETLNVALVA